MIIDTIISYSRDIVLCCVMLAAAYAVPVSHNPAGDELVNRPAMPAACYSVWNECKLRG